MRPVQSMQQVINLTIVFIHTGSKQIFFFLLKNHLPNISY